SIIAPASASAGALLTKSYSDTLLVQLRVENTIQKVSKRARGLPDISRMCGFSPQLEKHRRVDQ
ncbi:MAG: hypothetical protein SH850_02070, partial [Planctomycetaceae bacterium]|nr:hypothetical protein [Planctomycetaceae bacterium]